MVGVWMLPVMAAEMITLPFMVKSPFFVIPQPHEITAIVVPGVMMSFLQGIRAFIN
jgi:hypothetical protein